MSLAQSRVGTQVCPLCSSCGIQQADLGNRKLTGMAVQGYVAPEVLTNERHYDSKLSDVWSCGVMLYAMLFCRYPFEVRAVVQPA